MSWKEERECGVIEKWTRKFITSILYFRGYRKLYPNDPYYKRSEELLNILKTGKYGQIFTSTYIIAETLTLVAIRTKNNSVVLKEIEDFFIGGKQIARILRPDEQIESET